MSSPQGTDSIAGGNATGTGDRIIQRPCKGQIDVRPLQGRGHVLSFDPWTLSTAIECHACGVKNPKCVMRDPWTLSTAIKGHAFGVKDELHVA